MPSYGRVLRDGGGGGAVTTASAATTTLSQHYVGDSANINANATINGNANHQHKQPSQPSQPQQQPSQPSQPPQPTTTTTSNAYTRVDGKGLWRSWKRNFKNKMLALLDLIDNSLDAAIIVPTGEDDVESMEEAADFVGRVHIYPDGIASGGNGQQGGGNGGNGGVTSRYFNGSNGSNNGVVPQRANSAPEAIISNTIVGRNDSVIDLSLDDDDAQPQLEPQSVPSNITSHASSSTAIPTISNPTITISNPTAITNNNNTTTKTTGLCIVNNALRPIRPLVQALEVYNSSKIDSGAGDIGENGVGLKQGCATLSDLSFVLVKNGPDKFVELGMIAESLQKAEGCYLPAFRFNISQTDDVIENLKDQMTTLFTQPEHRDVVRCIERYGSVISRGNGESDMEKGIDRLLSHFDSVLNFYDSKYVFAVILDDISYGNSNGQQHRAASSGSSSDDPIKDLRAVIPKTYLHIPPTFDFRIGDRQTCGRGTEKVVFHYWPQRLVELSSFSVMVNENVPWHDAMASIGAYKLRVFLGFDRFRIRNNEAQKACSLYVYSRESGRMIKYEPDARFALGLNASGSMYCSGLTVLIDDVEGRLPLNPTKQDVAFGEQANGEVHRMNLFAWVSAVAKFYYDYHLAKFDGKKMKLTMKLNEFGPDSVHPPLKEIDRSHLTSFDLQYRFYAKRSIRIDQKSVKENVGRDTHFSLVGELPLRKSINNRPPFVTIPHPPPGSADDKPDVKRRRISNALEQTIEPMRVKSECNVRVPPQQNVGAVAGVGGAQYPPRYPPPQHVVHRPNAAGQAVTGAGGWPNPLGGMPSRQTYADQGVSPPPGHTGSSGTYPPHHVSPQQQQHLSHQGQQQQQQQQLLLHARQPQYTNGHNQHTQRAGSQYSSVSAQHHVPPGQPQRQHQQHNGHVGAAQPITGNGMPPPSPITSNGLGESEHQTAAQRIQEKRAERFNRVGRAHSSNIVNHTTKAWENHVNDGPSFATTTVKAPGNHAKGRQSLAAKDTVEATSNHANGKSESKDASVSAASDVTTSNGQDEDDDDGISVSSHSSTKEFYVDLCNQLSQRMLKKKGVESENRRLKKEIVELKQEVERQKLLLDLAQPL